MAPHGVAKGRPKLSGEFTRNPQFRFIPLSPFAFIGVHSRLNQIETG